MAIFIVGPDSSLIGETVYMLIHNQTAQVWNGSAFVDYDDTDRGDYAIAMTPGSAETSLFTATIPAALTGSVYFPTAFVQSGASPALTDETAVQGTLNWSGTAVVTPYSLSQQIAGVAAAVWSYVVRTLTTSIGVPSRSPVNTDGDLEIVQGDDYGAETGQWLEFIIEDYDGPSVTGESATLTLQTKANYHAGETDTELGPIVATTLEVTNGDLLIRFPATSAQTGALESSPADDRYNKVAQVVLLTDSGTKRRTLFIVAATVTKRAGG
jgi:hypothetical protein